MTSLPTHISAQQTPDAGKCLFTSKDIAGGDLVFRIDQPLALVLDAPRLRDTCEGCLQWMNDGSTGVGGGDEDGGAGQEIKKLRDCMGCRVVKYCGKKCQSEAWKTHHKYECKIFKSLYPKVLPNTVRLLMQLLLRRAAGSLNENAWRDFLALQSHLDEFKAQTTKNSDGLTTWGVIELMSEAASSYSRTNEPLPFIQSMAARVLINTHTLTAPSLDPLGLCLSPTSALLNHSCKPNTAITFSDRGALSVRSLDSIPASTPLSISYIDSILPTSLRRAELSTRYHFTCRCPLCLANCTSTLSNPDLPQPPTTLHQTLETESTRLLAAATENTSSDPDRALRHLQQANALFVPHAAEYPPHRHPRPMIHAQILLTSLNRGQWTLAFAHALVAYFHIDPIHYVPRWHPVRVVRRWVALRLAIQLANPDDGANDGMTMTTTTTATTEGQQGQQQQQQQRGRTATDDKGHRSVNWPIVIMGLYREVVEDVVKSHGRSTQFAAEVHAFGERNGFAGREVPVGEVEREWTRLRGWADEVLR